MTLKIDRDQIKYKVLTKGKWKEQARSLRYTDIPSDKVKEGWVSVEDYLPADFDLVWIKTPHRVYTGWSTGNGWDGLRLQGEVSVFSWKKMPGI